MSDNEGYQRRPTGTRSGKMVHFIRPDGLPRPVTFCGSYATDWPHIKAGAITCQICVRNEAAWIARSSHE